MWSVRKADPQAAQELGRRLGVAPVVAQVLLQRGLGRPEQASEFLNPKLAGLSSPEKMADRDVAADRIASAIARSERVAIFGDYDVDGATSAAILADVIEALGGQVKTFVADRFSGGYGFSETAWQAIAQHEPQLLITCDCGSADHPRIAQAREQGVDVIVVDHHLVPEEPLPALAFINPHRPECDFPYKGMCSAGLAFSLGAAVRKRLGAALDMRPWLDLVALGTIADVAPLDGDNRILVRAGLSQLGAQHVRPGLEALRDLCGLRPGPVAASDIAFRLGPRLNAPGRLGEPELALRLLRAKSQDEARGVAARIEALNEERKRLQQEVTQAALEQIREVYGAAPEGPVVAANRGWHRGVLGIVAARVAEEFAVPAIVVGFDDGVGVGSGRTVGAFDLHQAVSRVQEHLLSFGGHRAALGVQLEQSKLDSFRDALSAIELVFDEPTVVCDIEVGTTAYGLPRASDLQALEPLGAGNPEPIVSVQVDELSSAKRVGQQGDHLKLGLRVAGARLSAFGLGMGDDLVRVEAAAASDSGALRLRGMLRPDRYRGGEAIELRLEGIAADSSG